MGSSTGFPKGFIDAMGVYFVYSERLEGVLAASPSASSAEP